MALLTTQERTEIFIALSRWASDNREQLPNIIKNDLYNASTNTGAIAETDIWIDGNSGNSITVNEGYNATLNIIVRSNFSAFLKTVLFVAVAARRVNLKTLETVLGVRVN